MPNPHRSRSIIVLSLVVLLACGDATTDAYGNFEATELTVASESSGRLLSFTAEEGTPLVAGSVVGVVDTVPLALQRAELLAREGAVRARGREADAMRKTLETQLAIATREYERIQRLRTAAAATVQQEDRAGRDASVLRDQLAGAGAARTVVSREAEAIKAQRALLDDRIRRSVVTAPSTGTVLTRYAEPGEFVQPGTPLFKMAALDTLIFRGWVSGTQLSSLRLGASVTIYVDRADGGLTPFGGRVEWIAANAEFTPTPVQTREERTTQVYAVKVAVPNPDGALKIGMPGELRLQ